MSGGGRAAVASVTVYSRPGCHLCEELLDELLALVQGNAGVEVVNIDTREDLQRDYATRIPVVEIDGRVVCQYRLDAAAVVAALAARCGGATAC